METHFGKEQPGLNLEKISSERNSQHCPLYGATFSFQQLVGRVRVRDTAPARKMAGLDVYAMTDTS